MTSRTLRRRLHHSDVDGKGHERLETSDLDGLNEPLLGNQKYDNRHSEVRLYLDALCTNHLGAIKFWLIHFLCCI